MGWLRDETGLARCAANFTPLTPLSHLRRAADLFAPRDAIIYGTERRSYGGNITRGCRNWPLRWWGGSVAPGDVVATALAQCARPCRSAFSACRPAGRS